MRFEEFCASHGLVVDSLVAGRWMRVSTTDHPRKKNGAYKFLGDIGWVQNHALQAEVATWRVDANTPGPDTARIAEKAAEFERHTQRGWARAAANAQALIARCTTSEHNYLHFKGLPAERGLVAPNGALIVPMRHHKTNALMGAQTVRWLPEAMKYEKKMLPGMRAKGAVLRLGSPQAPRSWLVEGYATGLSLSAALRLLRLRDSVTVCFSAGNLMHVAPLLPSLRIVFADHDESGAGERAARATELPFCMTPKFGDANDWHKARGIFALADLITIALRGSNPVP